MTRPDVSDREAVAKAIRDAWCAWARTQANPKPSWLVLWEECDAQTKDADYMLADLFHRLVAREVEREREACAKIAREMARQARAASNEHGEKDVEEAEAAEAIDIAAASMAETIEAQIRARGRTA